jgi:hypothetical protein
VSVVLIAGLLACSEPDTDVVADAPVCPPEGEDAVLDFAFTDCAGAAVSLHDLCGAPALITAWYGWCPTCNDNATLGRALAEEHPGLTVAVALTEDPLADPVDAELCVQYEQTYPSRVLTWIDADAVLAAYGTMDLVLVLDDGGEVAFSRETSTESTIRTAVDAVLP